LKGQDKVWLLRDGENRIPLALNDSSDHYLSTDALP
jgi:hypothetical protein